MPKRLRIPPAEKKALLRVELARASYTKAEDRVGDLRLELDRAEQKLAKRAERLSTAEAALTALIAPPSVLADAVPAAEAVAAPSAATVNGATPSSRPQSRRKAPAPDKA